MASAVHYPVQVDATLDAPLSRWRWLFKWLLAIPHYVILAFLWLAFFVLSVVAFVAILFTGSYVTGKVLSAYRDNANHLEVFSRAVNEQAVAHHWRYEVISGDGGGYEGMLLYLQKPRFLKPDEAVQEWNREALDALVVPKDKISELMRELQNAAIAPFRSVDRKTDPQIGYFLVTRRN